ncbi:hypothetical protein FD06_GL001373 [Apilactobacillus ozensis DSM 23829 = JCM 17196]|uniref:Uncharacterized protein n=2 Tax=Apilactobacillus ozensis TaxID=866801 RepID=A0A0R2ANA9_9LACO|nr:DUF3324 domain-containing protein [Apilactobacillus ozensis]KRM68159.1 hypothetical protein FD06_GL001373 [Apilactobacillus ozensis DSM 23829 = JCM 17196]
MNNIKAKMLLIASFILFIFSLQHNVYAAKVGGIAMEPVYSKNQISKNGYLNPRVKPGSYQNFDINILSMSDKNQKITVEPHTAYTSDGISVAYDKDKIISKSNMKNDFRFLFKNKSITFNLPAGKTYRVRFTAKIPNEEFNGIIMGGFYITNNDALEQGQDTGTMINNKYSYVMPAVLNEDGKKAVPKLTLDKIDANGNIVSSKIENKKSAYIDSMSIYSKITNSSGKVVSEYEGKDKSVAPNTNFYLDNLMYSGNIRPGKYHIKIVAKSTDPYKWVMEKDFSVSSAQYIGYIIESNQWILYLILILLLLILILIIFIIKKRKEKNND